MTKILPTIALLVYLGVHVGAQEPLGNTNSLTWEGDIASRLVDAADAFLLKEIERSVDRRARHWRRDTSSPEAYAASVETNRKRFGRMIGVRDERVPFDEPNKALIGRSDTFEIYAITWPAFGEVHGEGLLLEPKGPAVEQVILIPDADHTPEDMLQAAQQLAGKQRRVVVPVLVNREVTHRKLTNREFLYRSAFELGRHLIGYEIQKVLAIVDWYERQNTPGVLISVCGWREGGLLAFYSAALDHRIGRAVIVGYFGSRQNVWQEPAYRNVFGLLDEFGDAEIASLIAPRELFIVPNDLPKIEVPPGTGGKPGRLISPSLDETAAELKRAIALTQMPEASEYLRIGRPPEWATDTATSPAFDQTGAFPDAQQRHARQMQELDRHNQWLLRESTYVRAEFMKNLKTDSIEAFEESQGWYRDYFAKEVIGQFDYPLVEPNVRTRWLHGDDKVRAYEVVLDVYEDFFAYGILTLPRGIELGDPRPVVVCQHGLEGRPQSVIAEKDFHYYKAFATKLAERGFITFAPQHLYIFGDRFRTLQFKANAIKKTLFSLMVPQHQQLTRWLGSLPYVDANSIAFYGLSYGGKSAMRIPPLVPGYCLSICSADFNEWVWKNASTRSRYSYVWTGEYEIFEWDLGSTFNYAEMAALIAPRPFMVERGHFDGVAPDETVAHEYAKVRHLYAAKLKIPQRTEIEWFDGPHSINGKATYRFLHKHLDWPEPTGEAE